MERVWFGEALSGGMSAAGVRLGTVLMRGWFWARVSGCAILYRGHRLDGIDWTDILAVADTDSGHIGPPQYVEHGSNSTYFYIVRCANHCGELEDTQAAIVRFSTDSDGELVKPCPNRVCGLSAAQVNGQRVKLVWFYEPLCQQSVPLCFNVYSNSGTGEIDFNMPVGQIAYAGRRFYSFEGDIAGADELVFAVKAEDADGIQSVAVRINVQINRRVCEPAEVINVE